MPMEEEDNLDELMAMAMMKMCIMREMDWIDENGELNSEQVSLSQKSAKYC